MQPAACSDPSKMCFVTFHGNKWIIIWGFQNFDLKKLFQYFLEHSDVTGVLWLLGFEPVNA